MMGGSGSAFLTPTARLQPGPKYSFECLPEGRKIASVIIDFTLEPVTGFNSENPYFSLPELRVSSNSNAVFTGYQIVTFDLRNFLNGDGLSEVRSMMCYSRPGYRGSTDVGATQDVADFVVPNNGITTPLCTSLQTNQTVPLGGLACAVCNNTSSGLATMQSSVTEFQTSPFVGVGSSIPVRVVKLVNTVDGEFLSCGKYQLQFCNWDIQPVSQLGWFFTA